MNHPCKALQQVLAQAESDLAQTEASAVSTKLLRASLALPCPASKALPTQPAQSLSPRLARLRSKLSTSSIRLKLPASAQLLCQSHMLNFWRCSRATS